MEQSEAKVVICTIHLRVGVESWRRKTQGYLLIRNTVVSL